MLIKLTAEQIGHYWDDIRQSILDSVPPIAHESDDKMDLILQGLLTDNIQCWISVRDEEEGSLIDAILTTSITHEPYSDTRALLIYSLAATRLTKAESWISGIETLKKYAQGKKCTLVLAYSDNPQIIKICEKLGGNSNYRLISFDPMEQL